MEQYYAMSVNNASPMGIDIFVVPLIVNMKHVVCVDCGVVQSKKMNGLFRRRTNVVKRMPKLSPYLFSKTRILLHWRQNQENVGVFIEYLVSDDDEEVLRCE